jgi:hypothetical protein
MKVLHLQNHTVDAIPQAVQRGTGNVALDALATARDGVQDNRSFRLITIQ